MVVIGRSEARRGHKARYLEGGVTQRFAEADVHLVDRKRNGDNDDCRKHYTEVPPELLIHNEALYLPAQKQIVAAEVDAEQKHEYRTGYLTNR